VELEHQELPVDEEAWSALHLQHSGEDLFPAYRDFMARYPDSERTRTARAVLEALDDLRAGDRERFLGSLRESAGKLADSRRFGQARALLAAAERLAEREGSPGAAVQFREELQRVDQIAREHLSRRQEEISRTVESGLGAEAFRSVASLSTTLGDLPAFARALLEFERAFTAFQPVHHPPLHASVVEHVGRARVAQGACRFREAQSEYLLALASGPSLDAGDRARLWRKSSEVGQIARMFETAVPRLQEIRPRVLGVSTYPVAVVEATGEEIEYQVLLDDAPPVSFRRRWVELRDPIKLRFLTSVPLSGEALLGLAHYAWEIGDDAAADGALLRLYKGSDRWHDQIHAALAVHRGEEIPRGGYEVYRKRFLNPAEKARLEEERRLAREREERAERELAAARKSKKLDRFLATAMALRQEGHFELAHGLYRAIAARFPDLPVGREAADRIRDPVLRVLRIPGIHPPAKPGNRITLYFLGEGYPVQDDDQALFDAAARRLWNILIKEEPYREYASYFDAVAVNLGSTESGVDRMPGEVKRKTALGGQVAWDSFSCDGSAVREVVRSISPGRPWQAVVIGNASASSATGGGGISSIPKTSLGALPHELGHALGGLHDEYDMPAGNNPGRRIVKSRAGGIPPRAQPPNLARGSVREEVLKIVPWLHWIEAGEDAWWNRNRVEVFEGGGYSPVEVWRPQANCKMRYGGMFCVVCMETMVKAIYRHVRPIDEIQPPDTKLTLPAGSPLVMEAVVLKPRSHFLEAKWRFDYSPPARIDVAGAAGAAGQAGTGITRALPPDRAAPGQPQPRVDCAWYRRIAPGGRVVEGLRIRRDELKQAGTYRFTLEVRDPTPWVLKDERGLLSQTQTWTVEVGE